MNIQTLLKTRRDQLGLSLRGLALRCAVDPAHLSRIEAGTAPPSDALLGKLAGALAVPLDEL